MVALMQRPAPTFKAEAAFSLIEILAFNDALPRFKELNTAVFVLPFRRATQLRKEGGLGTDLKLPLIADGNMNISRGYGVLLEDEGISLRGLFIIDPKGTLRQITVNDLPVGRSVEETIRLIQAFQYTDKHGEVCPANWTQGSKTIKTDPVAKLEYFSVATNGQCSGETTGSTKKRLRVE
ncbi:thioredoxin-like protein [Phlegmacium glaucopus]|nr:thioredoxin-like protein [Phlegmacium glaucopus]